MNSKELVLNWFACWEDGRVHELPISEDFEHISPFGTIQGKDAYLDLVLKNKDKFLGYRFEIHELLYEKEKACVRYTALQGEFSLDVSEWYEFRNDEITRIRAYYHIGEILDERKLKD